MNLENKKICEQKHKAGFKEVVSKFYSDMKDGDAYVVLLNTLAAECCNSFSLEFKDLMEKSQIDFGEAEKNLRRFWNSRISWKRAKLMIIMKSRRNQLIIPTVSMNFGIIVTSATKLQVHFK
jgi:hypothetical protein